jgi:hypothetical protein
MGLRRWLASLLRWRARVRYWRKREQGDEAWEDAQRAASDHPPR